MTILLVDDDRDQLELRAALFEKNGLTAMTATTAAAALKGAKAGRPQCAVLDLRIPTEAAGLGLIRELKAMDSAIHIFVLTGGDAKRINALPERELVDEVIVKGSSSASLVRKVKELADDEEPLLAELRARLAKDKVVTFDVKAMPRAARSEVVGVTTDGAMKVKIAAVPDKGKANEELRDVLAEWFKVPKNNVELLHGETSQHKVWRVRK